MPISRKILLWTNGTALVINLLWLYLLFQPQIEAKREIAYNRAQLALLSSSPKVNIVICGIGNSHTCVFNLLTNEKVSQESFRVVDTDTIRYVHIPELYRIDFTEYIHTANLLQKTFQQAKGPFKLIYVVSTTEGRIANAKYMMIHDILETIHNPDTPWGFVMIRTPPAMKAGYVCNEGTIGNWGQGRGDLNDKGTFIDNINTSKVGEVGKMRAHVCLKGCDDSLPPDENKSFATADKSVLQQMIARLPEFNVDPQTVTNLVDSYGN